MNGVCQMSKYGLSYDAQRTIWALNVINDVTSY